MADPPLLTGAVQLAAICRAPATTRTLVGAPGSPAGVAEALDDAVPVPAEVVALTRNRYEVPLVNPVTVAVVLVDVPSLNVDHDEPLLDENSTT
jgi:hypothetical protein